MWQVYILKCVDGSLYTGVTDNLQRRFEEHISGKGGRHTKLCRPTEIIFSEKHETHDSAEQREQQIKRWSKAKKLALIKGNKTTLVNLSKSRD